MPIEVGNVAPEEFKGVEVAGVGGEDVDDDVEEVEEDPAVRGEAFEAGRFFAQLVADVFLHFGDDGAELAGAGAGGDDEKVGDGTGVAQVEDDDVAAAVLGGNAGKSDGEVTATNSESP